MAKKDCHISEKYKFLQALKYLLGKIDKVFSIVTAQAKASCAKPKISIFIL